MRSMEDRERVSERDSLSNAENISRELENGPWLTGFFKVTMWYKRSCPKGRYGYATTYLIRRITILAPRVFLPPVLTRFLGYSPVCGALVNHQRDRALSSPTGACLFASTNPIPLSDT
ncbi:hypothetical protein U1Q18_052122 [Sarracenia purpurea var. burkii]